MNAKHLVAGVVAAAFLSAPIVAAAQDSMPAQPVPYSQLNNDNAANADMKAAKADRKLAHKMRRKAHKLARRAQHHARKAIDDSAKAQKEAVPAPPQ